MDSVCRFRRALRFKTETPELSRASGKVKLPRLHEPLEPLASLSLAPQMSPNIPWRISGSDSGFQMTSFGATEVIRYDYMPCFKVYGQVYHQLGSP